MLFKNATRTHIKKHSHHCMHTFFSSANVAVLKQDLTNIFKVNSSFITYAFTACINPIATNTYCCWLVSSEAQRDSQCNENANSQIQTQTAEDKHTRGWEKCKEHCKYWFLCSVVLYGKKPKTLFVY